MRPRTCSASCGIRARGAQPDLPEGARPLLPRQQVTWGAFAKPKEKKADNIKNAVTSKSKSKNKAFQYAMIKKLPKKNHRYYELDSESIGLRIHVELNPRSVKWLS